jgi:acyl dehydratase
MTLLTDEIRGHIGREIRYQAREAVGSASIRYYAMAIAPQNPNPLYIDADYARAAGYQTTIAPPTLVFDTCQYADKAPEERGYFGHSWALPVRECVSIRVSNEYEMHRPILPHDWISVTWKLDDIVERSSSRGGTQLFIYSTARFYAQPDELVAINRECGALQPRGPR